MFLTALFWFYTLSQFRKINKVEVDGGTEWTEKLQPADLEANAQSKDLTCYTPFYFMFEETLALLTF